MLTDQQRPDASGAGSPTSRWRRPLAIAGGVVVLVAIIAGVVWGVTRGNAGLAVQPHATSSATATPAPRVVYQSDWSHGADAWTLPASVTVADGHLAISGSQAVQVEIPYVPTTRNYTIEMDYQIVRAEIGGHFGLTAFNGSGDRQYLAQMECTPMHQGAWNPSLGGCVGAVLVTARGGTYPAGLFTSDYVVHGGAQSFSLGLEGDTVNFCSSGDCVSPVSSATPMDPSPHLMIDDRAVNLIVTRITVTA
ncbi:MAG TPA: hypothetical protein VH591_15190 [Ktedonobacterales bacterium]|jgi:hypothetical protein